MQEYLSGFLACDLATADLHTAVAGMTAEQVLSRPIPGKWSTLEVVAHLAGTEDYSLRCGSASSP